MPAISLSPYSGRPLLDLVSLARPGPGRRDRLGPSELAHISRTARRVPEVMVKVLSRGGQNLAAVSRHVEYLRNREEGELSLVTDDGQSLLGADVAQALLKDWDLDLEEHRRRSTLDAGVGRSAKLVHKLMFSMPKGAPPDKVFSAVQHFAREEFGLKHRYAMVLHTDEPHPHVHMVVKAVSEGGVRLHIRKATLREWRHEFARQLRALGVPANATERAVRGGNRLSKSDGVYRSEKRGDSVRTRERAEALSRYLPAGALPAEPGKDTLLETRRRVQQGWSAAAAILEAEGHPEIAAEVRRFSREMEPPTTARESLLKELRENQRRTRKIERPRVR
jgi:Relaxase/Mobilisation nuclease domain